MSITISNQTTPSTDIPNQNVGDGGRTVEATPGADSIQGSVGSDDISTLEDDDLVAAGPGNDKVSLGTGDDIATVVLTTMTCRVIKEMIP